MRLIPHFDKQTFNASACASLTFLREFFWSFYSRNSMESSARQASEIETD
jgi:hypothetical protein